MGESTVGERIMEREGDLFGLNERIDEQGGAPPACLLFPSIDEGVGVQCLAARARAEPEQREHHWTIINPS